MAPRKTATATATAPDAAAPAPADLGIDLSDQAARESIEKAATAAGLNLSGVPEPGIVTEDQGEGDESGDWPDVDYLPLYPVNEAGVPDSGTELFDTGDHVAEHHGLHPAALGRLCANVLDDLDELDNSREFSADRFDLFESAALFLEDVGR